MPNPTRRIAMMLCLALATPALAQAPAPETSAPAAGAAVPAEPAAPAEPAEITALSPYISDVQVLGPWTAENASGVWRTVLLQKAGEPTGNRFFVQQLQENDGTLSLVSSTEITEVAELDGAIVGYRADQPSEDSPSTLSLYLDIVPLDGEISETYELFMTPGEAYRFGPASN
ncbi:hypothetical protein [Aureimonas frigidaquae]|uniref:DNA topoisomerase IV subunit B n=1 Tax=Aureimonas frigidaquae TaxID=424757 RepID=A0A0P0Z3L3_9HYPH|nr:hypothetical protein [Aureimonas frigidaquae]BAT28480.1 DNA topoisomerase IV subunit B [Aureimonas frigidaquae]